ncbi:hypothetical protein Jiend_17820 [Micromonospora endophytica]|nr:hypothetical protein Jiend_17820 [Micromonospora endophytica]
MPCGGPELGGRPRDTPWNTRDVEVITPEKARVIFTAGKPFDPASQEARNLAAVGIAPPGAGRGADAADA